MHSKSEMGEDWGKQQQQQQHWKHEMGSCTVLFFRNQGIDPQALWAKIWNDISLLFNFQQESTKMESPGQVSAERPFEKDVSCQGERRLWACL